MLRYITLILLLFSFELGAQRVVPADALVPKLWGTDFTFARPSIFHISTASNFRFTLAGSNSDNYKALPHTNPVAALGRYYEGSFNLPLLFRLPPPRDYPYVRISHQPQRLTGSSWVELISETFSSRLHFFSFHQNSGSFFPELGEYTHMPALSTNLQIEEEGDIYFLATSIDGLSADTSRYYNENGIDNDTIFILKPNYTRRDFDTVRVIRHPVKVDADFRTYLGPFDFNPSTRQIRYFRNDTLLIYDATSIDPLHIIPCPSIVKLTSLKQLNKVNYQAIRLVMDTVKGMATAARLLRWEFKNGVFAMDSFDISINAAEFWPKEDTVNNNLYANIYLDTADQDLTLQLQRYVLVDSLRWVVDNYLVKLTKEGKLVWKHYFAGEEFPATISTFAEIKDTLLIGGAYFPDTSWVRRVTYRYPYFRRFDPQGNLLSKSGQVINQAHLEIYPSPFKVDLTIEALGLQRFQLLDQFGRVIKDVETNATDSYHTYYWPDLLTGLYHLRLIYIDGTMRSRSIVKLPY